MRRKYLFLTAFAGLCIAAAGPPSPIRRETLGEPLSLVPKLLGHSAPEIVEAQAVLDPYSAQWMWEGAAIYFAPYAHATGRNGLCRLEMQMIELRTVDARDIDHLVPLPPQTVSRYALAGQVPDLSADGTDGSANELACRALTPFLNRNNWQLVKVSFAGQDADPTQAGFAFHAMMEARRFEHAALSRCSAWSELACRDPSAFLRRFDPRDLLRLDVAPCGAESPNLCVTGIMHGEVSDSLIGVRAETGEPALLTGVPPLLLRSVTLSAEIRPSI